MRIETRLIRPIQTHVVDVSGDITGAPVRQEAGGYRWQPHTIVVSWRRDRIAEMSWTPWRFDGASVVGTETRPDGRVARDRREPIAGDGSTPEMAKWIDGTRPGRELPMSWRAPLGIVAA